jgi:hypothetical protein
MQESHKLNMVQDEKGNWRHSCPVCGRVIAVVDGIARTLVPGNPMIAHIGAFVPKDSDLRFKIDAWWERKHD